jgi:hypothetical protein
MLNVGHAARLSKWQRKGNAVLLGFSNAISQHHCHFRHQCGADSGATWCDSVVDSCRSELLENLLRRCSQNTELKRHLVLSLLSG